MPSEQRLHPVSVLFGFGRSLKAFAVPGLIVLVAGRSTPSAPDDTSARTPAGVEFWLMLLLVPAVLHSIARYVSFRIQYESTDLVIRSGLLFRNVRHVPYARIQNIESVSNLFHRLFGVVEIRVETASGREPEAVISVMPLQAFDEMRRRVFAHRPPPDAAGIADGALEESGTAPARDETRLALSLRDLLLCGFIENRGMVVIAALYGLLWELGPIARIWSQVFDEGSYGAGIVRETFETIAAGRWPPVERLAVLAAVVVSFLLLVRLVSMGWTAVTLYGFRLSQVGEDLRTEFGLLTRVAATIPVRRIQKVTIRETPIHRLTGRVSVRVETAGGGHTGGQAGTIEREWLAPLIRTPELPALLRHVISGVDLHAIDWRRVHPRAFRRAVKPAAGTAVIWTLASVAVFGPSAVVVLPVALGWFALVAWKRLDYLRWAADDHTIVFRSGWLWRAITIAPTTKIQVVGWRTSPFDRRTGMARVRVDTAGAGDASHRIEIPYLPHDTARALHAQLAERAATTHFRW